MTKYCKLVVSRSLSDILPLLRDNSDFRESLAKIALKQIVLIIGCTATDNEVAKLVHQLQPTINIMRSSNNLGSSHYFADPDYCLFLADYRASTPESKRRNTFRLIECYHKKLEYTKVFKFYGQTITVE